MRPELLLCLLALLALPAGADPLFRPVPVPVHVYDGGWEHFTGGGVAVFDCDGDHLPEIAAAGGSNPVMLLRNRGAMRFEAQTPAALAVTGATGLYPLDIDGDGHPDLVVLRAGPDLILKGGPDCGFAPHDGLGFDSGDRWSTAFSATWEPGQSLPTLAFGSYVDRADPDGPFEACDVNLLYRPEGDRYGPPLPLAPGFCALSMLFSDWGGGRADLRVSNDRHYYVTGGQEQMWAMEPVPRLYGPADGWAPFQLWGMGIASRDISGDGRPEVMMTSMGDQRLQEPVPGADGPAYADVPYARGTSAHRPHAGADGRPSTGWHVEFGDVDNDGRDDIFIAKGNVDQMPDMAMEDPNSLLRQDPDGTFREVSVAAGVASAARSRGAALADLDLDGRLDLVVSNRRAPLEVHRNATEGGGWLAVTLRQPAPNRDAIGAKIELRLDGRTVTREVTIGGGHAGGQLGPQHFGLGDAASAELRVHWPDGTVSPWQGVSVGRAVTVVHPGPGTPRISGGDIPAPTP
ncbi:CRTAC1 family protein [Mangrovicoccus algicola]|uniref:CRTAC1 family protein n=1 Tax=Mangrovicoccus algicola TaxID=2771008 RepID=A0A8J7CKD3_9RHOB|nr:CRTAC1 family protein [Mangrovicoccus algicola]MBE3638656.1 CRTAC1 family protein [Mangrovicoccus algicola]